MEKNISEFQIGYEICENRRRRGMLMYIKEGLKYTQIPLQYDIEEYNYMCIY